MDGSDVYGKGSRADALCAPMCAWGRPRLATATSPPLAFELVIFAQSVLWTCAIGCASWRPSATIPRVCTVSGVGRTGYGTWSGTDSGRILCMLTSPPTAMIILLTRTPPSVSLLKLPPSLLRPPCTPSAVIPSLRSHREDDCPPTLPTHPPTRLPSRVRNILPQVHQAHYWHTPRRPPADLGAPLPPYARRRA